MRLRFYALLCLALTGATRTNAAQCPVAPLRTNETSLGAITRGPKTERKIAFCFTAHSYGEGADVILDTLRKHKSPAGFFLTGEFLANTNFETVVRRMLAEGHYVGPHSDRHPLYCAWEPSRKTLVSRDEFVSDLKTNIARIKKFLAPTHGQKDIRYFLPPYEHYNAEIAGWTRELGITLINFTPGTRANADYTGEAEKNFVSSQIIYESILKKERTDPCGLNGFILLLHLGAGPGRTDKFHKRFPELCDALAAKGYSFVRVDELLARP